MNWSIQDAHAAQQNRLNQYGCQVNNLYNNNSGYNNSTGFLGGLFSGLGMPGVCGGGNNASSGEIAGQAVGMLALIGGGAILSGAQARSEARDENAAANNTVINNFIMARNNVTFIENSISTTKAELTKLRADLKSANESDTNIKALQTELKELNNKAGFSDTNKAEDSPSLQAYTMAQTAVEALTGAKSELGKLANAKTVADTNFKKFFDKNFEVSGTKTQVKVTAFGNGKAEQTIRNNQAAFETLYDKPANQGGTKCKLNESLFNSYIEQAKAKDTQYDELETAKNNADRALTAKQTEIAAYSKYLTADGTGSGQITAENIDTAIDNAKEIVNKNKGVHLNGNGPTVEEYQTKKQSYEAQIDKFKKLAKNKDKIESDITTKEALLEKLEKTDLPAAKKKLAEAEEKAKDIAKIYLGKDKSKADYKDAKTKFANERDYNSETGKKRNWWNKFWGTNLGADQKRDLQNRKATKHTYKDAKSLYKAQGYTDEQIKVMQEAGLIPKDT